MLSKIVQGFEAIWALQFSEKARVTLDYVNFALGFAGVYNLMETYYFKDREIKDLYKDLPLWQQTAWKTSDFLGNLSFILAGLKSRPALAFFQWGIQKIISPEQLASFLGRHSYVSGEKICKTVGIVSLLFGIPAALKTSYSIYCWIRHPQTKRLEEPDEHFYTPLPINKVRKTDVVLTVRTVKKVSATAHRLMAAPHN
jgi:hypothetical protein